MTRLVIVLGGGGHAKVLIDALQTCSIPVHGILDNDSTKHGSEILGVPVLGSDDHLKKWKVHDVVLVNALGSVNLPQARASLFERLQAQGYSFLSVVHPAAFVSAHAHLGEGAQVMAGAMVQTSVRVGNNCIVNTGARIDHDCVIGDHTHVAPGVTLSGDVIVGSHAHIGAGATIIQGIHVGKRCLVAAGAVVVQNLSDDTRVAGVPAKEIKS